MVKKYLGLKRHGWSRENQGNERIYTSIIVGMSKQGVRFPLMEDKKQEI